MFGLCGPAAYMSPALFMIMAVRMLDELYARDPSETGGAMMPPTGTETTARTTLADELVEIAGNPAVAM